MTNHRRAVQRKRTWTQCQLEEATHRVPQDQRRAMILGLLKLFVKEPAETVDHRVATTNDSKMPHTTHRRV